MGRRALEAKAMAEELLAAALPRRWKHVQAVARRGAELGLSLLKEDDRDILAAAAWLHDVGYAPDLAVTGFHPLDGARWLRSLNFDGRVAALVAHHSCAHLEADERGFAEELAGEFPREEGPV